MSETRHTSAGGDAAGGLLASGRIGPKGLRTDYCGELGTDDIDRRVTVCGWVDRRREHGEHLAFVDLRDRSGVVQCVVDHANDLRAEYVLAVTGTVRHRPEGTVNPDLPTGEVELGDCTVEVLSTSEPIPFPLDERTSVDEALRLRHRYIDLRKPRLQHNLALRSIVLSACRRAMEEQGFIEIDTPLLISPSPEGARDFIVPSRLHPGSVYALPQSPQLLKQLLMVSGMDRYYQVAKCLRDEDLRADRQFEFQQLDIEASFVGQEDVLEFVGHAIRAAAEAVTGERPAEIPRITWEEAAERYGSDKPDVRFAMELVELTPAFASTGFRAFAEADCIKGIRVPGGAAKSRNELDGLIDRAKGLGAKGLVWMKAEDGGLSAPVAKFLSEGELAAIHTELGAEDGDLVLLVADERRVTRHVLGQLRLDLGRPPVNEGGLHFVWVTEFPMFEALDDEGHPIPAHHPFTMPHPDDVELMESDPLAVRSQAYDLVLNGWELGSGSVRIHRPDIQSRVFAAIGLEEEEARAKFGFLLDAFRFGPPPHAGFVVGLDRLVALLAGEENIREVIAFPKTQSGVDPLTSAPSVADPDHLREVGLRALPPPVKGS